jgi:hypothetical protein
MAYLQDYEFAFERDIESLADNSIIADCIADAQQFVDSFCNRTFAGVNSDRKFDAVSDVEGGVLWVWGAGDLASINTVTNGNGDVIAGSAYVTEPRNAVANGKPIIGLRLKTNSSTYWRTAANGVAEDAITVNGVWAYSAEPPADIVRATKMLTGFYYDQRLSTNADIAVIPGVSVRIPSGIPSAVKQILNPYVRESF